MKRYSKNEEPFVYAAFSEHDAGQARAVLEEIEKNGVLFWHAARCGGAEARRIAAAYSVVVFLSPHAVRDENVLRCIEHAVRCNKKILCVYLEQTQLSRGLELLLNALQSMNRSAFSSEEDFLEKLKSAAVFSKMEITPVQRENAKRRALYSVLIPVAAGIAVFFAVVVPLLIVPAMKAATGSLSRVGFGNLSLAELAKVEELNVIAMRSYDTPYYSHYANEDRTEIIIEELGEQQPIGDISDVSDLTLLKNAKEIMFSANQISDITPLFALTSLEVLTLNCNPIHSIEGIEALQNLQGIDLSSTEVSDITPLFKIPSLDSIFVENTYAASIEGIEKLPHLFDLRISGTNVTDISALKKVDYTTAKAAGGFTLYMWSTYIRDYSALQSIPEFRELCIGTIRSDLFLPFIEGKPIRRLILEGTDIRSTESLRSIQNLEELELSYSHQLVSLEGLEVHTGLRYLRLTECQDVEDYSVLLKLPNLEMLSISAKLQDLVMAQLANADFEIFVEALPEDMQNEE